MLVYSIILFVIAAIFVIFGIFIFSGRIEFLIEYHRENVREEKKREFGRVWGIILLVFAFGLISAATIVLIDSSHPFFVASIATVGLFSVLLIVSAVITQRKYNAKKLPPLSDEKKEDEE